MASRDPKHASGPGTTVLVPFPPALFQRVTAAFPDVELVQLPPEGEPLPDDLAGEILLTPPWDTGHLAAVLERGVRWVHTIGTGVDRFPFEVLGERPLTCARGASAIPISEWILAVMLAFEKHIPEVWLKAPPEQWSQRALGGLHGRRLGLVGLGGIGQATARLALSFGMRVRAFRRSDEPSPIGDVERVSSLVELLAASDHVVLALPLTDASRHLIDAEALASIPAEAGIHFVNISRGGLVDQDALRAALDDGRIAVASLDVAEPEPLPEGHWIYSHPRVRFSPHVSWSMPGGFDWLIDTFIDNLRRYRAGEPLEGLVDRAAGY